MSATKKRGRSSGLQSRDRRREARTASRARAPRGYDGGWPWPAYGTLGYVTLRPMWDGSESPYAAPYVEFLEDGTTAEGFTETDATKAKWWPCRIDQGHPFECDALVMHADGRMVDPNCEEAKWL